MPDDASNIDQIYTKFSAFDPPFGGVIITHKQKFLSSFMLWHLTSLPTMTDPSFPGSAPVSQAEPLK